jgi:hypothetical protein
MGLGAASGREDNGRDDDAFDFCLHWFRGENEDMDSSTKRPGDWIYPRQKDSRLQNVFQVCGAGVEFKYLPLSMLVAVLFLKVRIHIQQQRLDILDSSESATATAAALKEQMDRLMDQIHANNATMLPCLIKPDKMLSQARPTAYGSGDPAEAYFVLDDALRVMRQSPTTAEAVQKILVARFGENPTYPYKMQSFNMF